MAVITDIADAVVTDLNGGSFSQPFTAERHYQPLFELADMKDLHVTVVPKAIAILPAGRALSNYDHSIDIAVQKKFDKGDPAELDPLMTLVEEIADHFRFRRLEGFPNAAWVKTENKPIYAQEHMEQLRQFTSILTLTYRVLK